MSFLAVIKVVISLLPTLLELVKSLEALMPESGQGSKKLEALKSIVQSAYETAQDTTTAFETVWPAISGTVSALVALLKK